MAKIDCSTVIGFAQEASRVCEMHEDCAECPMSVLEYDNPDIQEIIDRLQKWSDEHPQKTRLDDFKEKYPNAPTGKNGEPEISPRSLGYCGECGGCIYLRTRDGCWHEPLDGGATGKAVE